MSATERPLHADADATGTPEQSKRRRVVWDGLARYGVVLALLIVLFVLLSVTQSRFLTKANIENLLTGVSILWIVSLGMTFVVLTAGIDLSVGAILALVGVFMAKMFGLGMPSGVVIVLCLLFGILLGGALNGLLIGRLRLSFFVVTLGSMVGLTGAVNLWSKTKTTYVNSSLINDIGISHLVGVPVPIWIMIATFLVALFVQRSTYFGRDVYAVGGNIDAARLSGIRASWTIAAVYAITGGCAALASIIQVGRIGAASPDVGGDLALNAAAAVLLGGTSFVGGVGGVSGTIVGVLFIGTLQNGLGIAGVSSFWQQVVTGVILIAAVLIDRVRQNTTFRSRAQPAGAAAQQSTAQAGP